MPGDGFKIASAYVEITAKDDTASGVSRARRGMDTLRDKRVHIDVDVDKGLSSLSKLTDRLDMLGPRATKFGAIAVAALAGVGPAAGAALPALGSLALGFGTAAAATKDSLKAVSDYTKGMAGSKKAMQDYQREIADMTPVQREFTQQLIDTGGELTKLKRTAADSFLPGLMDGISGAVDLFPILDRAIEKTGKIEGDTARKLGDLFRTDKFKADLDAFLQSTLPVTRALGDGLVSLTGKVVEFGAKMAPAGQGFADFIRDVVHGFQGMLDNLAPHADSFRRIWEALGRIMQIVLPLVGDLVGWLADHLAPVLEKVAGFLERNRDSLSGWAKVIGFAVLAIKGLNIASKVVKWCDDIAGGIRRIGGAASSAKGKVGGLRGALHGLKGIGTIAIPVAVVLGLGEAGKAFEENVNKPFQMGPNGKPVSPGDRTIGQAFSQGASNALNQYNSNPLDAFKGFDPTTFKGWTGQTFPEFMEGVSNSPAGKISEWMDKNVGAPLDASIKSLKGKLGKSWSDLWGGLSGRTTKFATDNRVQWQGIKNTSTTTAGQTHHGVSGWWGRTFTDSDSWFNRTKNTIGQKMVSAKDFAVQKAGEAKTGISNWWGRTFGDSDSWFARTRNTISEKMRTAKDNAVTAARDAWRGVTDWWGRTWDDVKRKARDGINGVIGALNWLSGKANVVLRFLHVPEIPPIPALASGGVLGPQMLAAGGRVGGGFMTNGPQAIVGEGRRQHPEFVIPTDPTFRSRALSLYADLGAHLMAGGGVLPGPIYGNAGVGGSATGAVSSVGDKLSDAMTWLMGAGGGLLDGVLDVVRGMLPGEPWRGIGTSMARSAFDGIKRKITDSFMSFGGGGIGGSGVQRWAPLVLQVLAMLGQPAGLLGAVLRRMNQESGGNPGAINLWDSNARAGHPSQGLMQTIPSTFNTYAGPFRGRGILDPLANIYAGLNYALHRYPSLAYAMNKPGGYDSGGLAAAAGSLMKGPEPERVLSPRQTQAFEKAMDRDFAGAPTTQNFYVTIDAKSVAEMQSVMDFFNKIQTTARRGPARLSGVRV